ncbi:MAG TPA: PaaI family thioesterase [Pyrinomonadaceae bacterium]|nr:PaaI family thioesterase [Pyrinomonadaceae bacterium]
MTAEALSTDDIRRIHEAFERVPYAHLLGIEVGEMERGAATLYLTVRDELRQNRGVVHGGATASLVDTASAFAILTLLEPGETTTTIDLTIHYLRPLTAGRATAHATVRRAGRRVLTVSVDVLDEAQTLIATALTSYLRLS